MKWNCATKQWEMQFLWLVKHIMWMEVVCENLISWLFLEWDCILFCGFVAMFWTWNFIFHSYLSDISQMQNETVTHFCVKKKLVYVKVQWTIFWPYLVTLTFQAHPFIGGTPTPTSAVAFNPYINAGVQNVAVSAAQTNGESPSVVSQHHAGVIPTAFSSMATATKLARPDRLEVGLKSLPW